MRKEVNLYKSVLIRLIQADFCSFAKTPPCQLTC